MLRLYTFSSVYVVDEAGHPLTAASAQRRTLALLSALAVAGEGGLSRDKLVGLLWPESDAERARHSLTQALYLARRAVVCEDVFLVGADIRLNAGAIRSDVQDFEAALEAGDLQTAIDLYRGPFLDGFFLSGSSDFDQWLTVQRTRLEDRAIAALDGLANKASAGGDQRTELELRKRIAALRPLDSGAALRLMQVLAAAGDRAGALQHAHLHATLLRDQLDLSPDARITSLEAELREEAVLQPSPTKREAPAEREPEPEDVQHEIVVAPEDAVSTRSELHVHAAAASPPLVWVPVRSARRRITEMAVAGLALIGIGVLIGRGVDGDIEVTTLPVRQQVVVAPFRVTGASSSLSYLREGLVELLSSRLADDSAARSVDAGAVLGAWRRAGLTSQVDVPRDTVVRLARRLGAERVVIGSVVGTTSRAVVSATLVGVTAGKVQAAASVAGPADSIASLVDQLAARLLTSQAGEDVRLAERTTSSLSALHAYLQGQAAYRSASYAAALRAYGRALELDSTFALAALRLAIAADRANDLELHRRALAEAWRYREELDPRELAHLTALAGPRYPSPSTSAEQVAAWEQTVALMPDRAEAWYELGARLFRDGATLGLRDAHARAITAFQRALSIDPSFYLARHFLIQLSVRDSANGAVVRLPSDSALRDSLGSLAPFIRWRLGWARQDSIVLRTMQDTLHQLGPVNLRTIAMASQFDGVGAVDGERALTILLRRPSRVSERVDATLGLHSLALNQGEPITALKLTNQLAELEPFGHMHVRLRVLDALYGEGDTIAARQAVQELERNLEAERVAQNASSTPVADLCVLSQWRLAGGDTAGVRSTLAQLRAATANDPGKYLSVSPIVCAELIDAALAVKANPGSAVRQLQRLDSLALGSAVAGDANAYAHLLIARLYGQAGEPRFALDAIRRRSYMAGWPRYLATAWREEGMLAEALGDVDAALKAYERFLALRGNPEPAAQPAVDDVRQRMTKLTAQRAPGEVVPTSTTNW